MELDHRSCVLPSNAPALPDPSSAVAADTPLSSTHSRGILQERSANRRHDYATNNLSTSTSAANPATSTWKQSRSSSPTENIYSGNGQGQPTLAGNYFTGNVGSHHIGLTGLGGDKTEVQIERETERLWRLVHRCEKYQKYRERQPTSQKDKEQKWPNDLERAFFRALVRWPPMGRRKHMLEGQLRGRNELVAASIYKDTGIPRTRKQVSSHIQVLKNLVSEQPAVLVYMATEDIGGKRHRGHHSSHAHHLAHLRSRHPSSKYDFNAPTSHVWSNYHGLPSAPTLHKMQHGDSSPYTVADFAMFVQFKGHIEHDFTRLSADGRLSDLHITDIASWHQRYQELKFLPTDEWKEKGRRVLLCDASVKVMTEKPPLDADIIILFNLHSRHDLTVYERLQCTTRFYDNGNLAEQRESAGGKFWNVKETRTPCEYWPDHEAHAAGAGPSPGRLNVSFGSKFWATRMYDFSKQLQRAASAEEPSQRVKYESEVRRNLQYLTATQDIYGIKRGTGESQCLLTILWRFNQTKSSSEVGKMNWRVVNFSPHQSSSQKWMKEEEEMGLGLETDEMKVAKGLALDRATSTGAEPSLYPSTIPLDFHHHPSHPYAQHPPSLDLDTLSSMQLDAADFSHPNSATAPSMVTDYSQQSVPSLSHSQDTIAVTQSQEYPQDNEFDFNGGHITISGCLQPSMNMGGYDSYGSQAANMHNLNSLAGLEHDQSHDSFADLGLSAVVGGVTLSNCYSTKPAWHHSNLISTLEGAAEQYHTLLDQSQAGHGHEPFHPHHQGTHSEDIAGHGVLHDGQLNAGLWKLQSAFGEDTGVGAVADHRKDSHVGVVGGVGVGVGVGGNGVGVNAGNGQGMGILEMIERDQRVRGGY